MIGGRFTQYMIEKSLNNKKGVTLLELLVAIALFSVVILSATQIFEMVAKSQRDAIAAQNMQENLRYAMEVMSKEMRGSQRDDGSCFGNNIYATNVGQDALYFKNVRDECVTYDLDNFRLRVNRAGSVNYVTPDEIKINNLKFFVVDDIGVEQSAVTMEMDIEAVGNTLGKQNIKIQTTISSRYYE